MKTIQFIVVILAVTLSSSCIRFVDAQTGQPLGGRGGQSQTQHVQGERKLTSVTVSKTQTGYCEARIIAGPHNTPANVQRVADYASSQYMRTGRVPSESELTQKFGFRTQARWVDTPDRVVGRITVRPDEVPENIRARFQ